MVSIAYLLNSSQLPNSPTARLDVELLLAAALDRSVSYLHTWPEGEVVGEALAKFNGYLLRRQAGEPVAYILGTRGFWTLELQVAKQTLIPRPDTEILVETCLAYIAMDQAQSILDLGTGTGAIALAIASERPLCNIVGVDFIEEAVALAKQNRQRLGIANVAFLQSDWFAVFDKQKFNLIVSNPPYIACDDPHLVSGDLCYEPLTALVSGKDGLDDIRLIVELAPNYLQVGGWLFLEHGYQQAGAVKQLFEERGFSQVATYYDLGGNERVSGGQWLCS